jgi:ATP-dependent DNA ligase
MARWSSVGRRNTGEAIGQRSGQVIHIEDERRGWLLADEYRAQGRLYILRTLERSSQLGPRDNMYICHISKFTHICVYLYL